MDGVWVEAEAETTGTAEAQPQRRPPTRCRSSEVKRKEVCEVRPHEPRERKAEGRAHSSAIRPTDNAAIARLVRPQKEE